MKFSLIKTILKLIKVSFIRSKQTRKLLFQRELIESYFENLVDLKKLSGYNVKFMTFQTERTNMNIHIEVGKHD